ncbi:MAG: hypothetical protein ACKVOE_06660 [Rickettsiales bacterium]
MKIETVGNAWLGNLGGIVEPQCCRLSEIPKDKLQTALLGDRWGIEITPMESEDISSLSAIKDALIHFQHECGENDITLDFVQSEAGWVMFGDFTKLRKAYEEMNIYPAQLSRNNNRDEKAVFEYEQALSEFFDTALTNLEQTQVTNKGRNHEHD